MYKICFIIALFSTQFITAQENPNKKETMPPAFERTEVQDSLTSEKSDAKQLLMLNTAVKRDNSIRNSKNIRVSPIRRAVQVQKKKSPEAKLEKEVDEKQ
jgi:hypothetical protein